MNSDRTIASKVAEREGTLPNPLMPYAIQTVAEVNDQEVALQVYWPHHNDEPMWWVAQRGGAGWMKRPALARLRDEISRVLDEEDNDAG